MLQHDYLQEVISQFVEAISASLRRAKKEANPVAVASAEEDIAGLLDLDPAVAMQLSPDSLVTMMLLSGVGDSVAEYVSYALEACAREYAKQGQQSRADVRLAQAHAIQDSFSIAPNSVPEELRDLDTELKS